MPSPANALVRPAFQVCPEGLAVKGGSHPVQYHRPVRHLAVRELVGQRRGISPNDQALEPGHRRIHGLGGDARAGGTGAATERAVGLGQAPRRERPERDLEPLRPGAAGHQLRLDVLARQIVASRQHGLEQQHRPGTLGEKLAVQLQPDMTRTGQNVDAVKRISRMSHVDFVFLIPGIEGAEVQDHVAGQVCVGGTVSRSRTVLAARQEVYDLSLGGMHSEGNRRVEHGALGERGHGETGVIRSRGGGHGCRDQAAADVVCRNGIRRHDATRFPDQHRPGAVHDGHISQDGPDALGRRLEPHLVEPARQQAAQLDAHRFPPIHRRSHHGAGAAVPSSG